MQKAIATSKGQELVFSDMKNLTNNFKAQHNLCPNNGYNLINSFQSLNSLYQMQPPPEQSGFSENSTNFEPRTCITARDFRQIFIQENKQLFNNQAANLLGEKAPKLSAKFGLNFRQKFILLGFFLILGVALFTNPIASLYYFSFAATLLFLFAALIKTRSLFLKQPQNYTKQNLDDVDLPIYSILVPLYKEEAVIERLAQSLLSLNYPRSKLDIKLLFEEDDSLVCLQASLEFENWKENWLSKHFFIEYATQFNRFLPTLEKLHIPLPLGGTSNHYKTKILHKLFGWDAYNVTEDVDLGIVWLSKRHIKFGYVRRS